MRSSGSTRNLPRRPTVRLLLVLAGEDHPKACTGRRLLRLGRAVRVSRAEGLRPPPIVLDPHAANPLSTADRPAAERGGVLAVDCSWNRLAARGGLPPASGPEKGGGLHRRLPMLVAANPQHYGRVAELNTFDALSAALYLLGFPAEAGELLGGFRGGDGFLEVNRERLDRYARARSSDEVIGAEAMLFGGETPAPRLTRSAGTASR
jgi:pre-rRNA-processing protein TSR3